MPYDEHLGERISNALKEKRVRYDAKKMMGGLCFMIKDKMAMGVMKDSLLASIDPDIYQSALKKKGCRPMDFTGRIMKRFVRVDPIGIDSEKDLGYWIQCVLTLIQRQNPARNLPR